MLQLVSLRRRRPANAASALHLMHALRNDHKPRHMRHAAYFV